MAEQEGLDMTAVDWRPHDLPSSCPTTGVWSREVLAVTNLGNVFFLLCTTVARVVAYGNVRRFFLMEKKLNGGSKGRIDSVSF